MSAATPGQAAYAVVAHTVNTGSSLPGFARPWDDLDEDEQGFYNRLAAQIIAAQEPHAAPGEVVHLSPRDATYVTPRCGQTPFELTRADRMTNEPSLVTCGRPEPKAAPGGSLWLKHLLTFNRLGHALAALREIAGRTEGSGQGLAIAAHGIARNALDDDAAIRDNVAPTREPKAAPELAEQLRGHVRELIGIIVAGTASHPGIYARVGHIAAQAQIEPPAIIAVTRTESAAPELADDGTTSGQRAHRRWHEVRWPDSGAAEIAKEWEILSDRAKAAWEAAGVGDVQRELGDRLREMAADNIALRKLLDEIGVMAANAPEDGDSFGLLEEITMRIAAASVPIERAGLPS